MQLNGADSRGDHGMRKSMLAAASHARRAPTQEGLSEAHAVAALAALAQPTRLAIFRLLIKHEPIGITAGVIADTIGAPHNTLSSHLATLVRSGLLRSFREGRTIVYRADVDGMRSLISFLVDDCCDRHPELCNPLGLTMRVNRGETPKRAKLKDASKSKARAS